jgi:hypothetical protein
MSSFWHIQFTSSYQIVGKFVHPWSYVYLIYTINHDNLGTVYKRCSQQTGQQFCIALYALQNYNRSFIFIFGIQTYDILKYKLSSVNESKQQNITQSVSITNSAVMIPLCYAFILHF